ncbi:hypothetical protein VTJ49DRAFT_3395 [Mycothermus thermophilus]|uniref:DUF7371 domain-containing protein n=1 Tax=Humicola insolens TaxID=85995 RepID=A0ABR3V7Q5_HUMIN
MQLKASVNALAGIIWLAAAAVVPRFEDASEVPAEVQSSSLSPPGGQQVPYEVTYTLTAEPATPFTGTITITPQSPESIVFVTYTIPGLSGTGESAYTVSYTLPQTTASADPVMTPTSELPSPAANSTRHGPGTHPVETFTVTLTSTHAVTVTYGGSTSECFNSNGPTDTTSADPVSETPQDPTYGAPASSSAVSLVTSTVTETLSSTDTCSEEETPLASVTVLVTTATVTQTIPLGDESSTVVEFTTEFTIAPASSSDIGSLTSSSSRAELGYDWGTFTSSSDPAQDTSTSSVSEVSSVPSDAPYGSPAVSVTSTYSVSVIESSPATSSSSTAASDNPYGPPSAITSTTSASSIESNPPSAPPSSDSPYGPPTSGVSSMDCTSASSSTSTSTADTPYGAPTPTTETTEGTPSASQASSTPDATTDTHPGPLTSTSVSVPAVTSLEPPHSQTTSGPESSLTPIETAEPSAVTTTVYISLSSSLVTPVPSLGNNTSLLTSSSALSSVPLSSVPAKSSSTLSTAPSPGFANSTTSTRTPQTIPGPGIPNATSVESISSRLPLTTAVLNSTVPASGSGLLPPASAPSFTNTTSTWLPGTVPTPSFPNATSQLQLVSADVDTFLRKYHIGVAQLYVALVCNHGAQSFQLDHITQHGSFNDPIALLPERDLGIRLSDIHLTNVPPGNTTLVSVTTLTATWVTATSAANSTAAPVTTAVPPFSNATSATNSSLVPVTTASPHLSNATAVTNSTSVSPTTQHPLFTNATSTYPVTPVPSFVNSTSAAASSVLTSSTTLPGTAGTSSAPSTTSQPTPSESGPLPASSSSTDELEHVEGRDVAVLEFEDIPPSPARKVDEQTRSAAMLYHRFLFSEGFQVVSHNVAPREASSDSQMLEHYASLPAQIGLGHLREDPCFRFDFQGISLGCDSRDKPCTFEVSGLEWDGAEDVLRSQTTLEVAACPGPSRCALGHHALDAPVAPRFGNLTAINITLVAPDARVWWADDLRIAWTNDDCAAAACRAKVSGPGTPRSFASLVGEAKQFLRWAVRG